MAIDEPTVIYRDVPDLPGYRVGDDGTVWSRRQPGRWNHLVDAWRLLAPGEKDTGRRYVNIGGRTRSVYRLVLEAFVGPCPDGAEACHNDGNAGNDALANLRWDTRAANQADRRRHGTHIEGERVRNAKLTAAEVCRMREEYGAGASVKELALRYGVSWASAKDAVTRRTWRHVA